RLGAAVVPVGQPGPGPVRGRGRGRDRPGDQPALRLRARHPPLPRVAPGPHGAAGGAGDVAGPLPGVLAGGSRGGDLVAGPGAGPAPAADRDRALRGSRMRTKATELVGIDLPIFAFSHCRDVVAAVTNAGGCGVLGAVAHSPVQLDIDLRWIEDQVKGKPYGVDPLVPEKFVGAEEGGLDRASLARLLPDEHRRFVDELLDRYEIPPMPED